jgi:hypothetical protein
MKNVNISDAELTAYSGDHLLYEIQMFLFTAKELSRQAGPSPMTSVLIESFVIHLRNLIEFFYTPTGSERDDDVIAADFCPGWNESTSATLKEAKMRANKELSHLTLGRKKACDPTKPWDIRGLFNEVRSVALRFACEASPTRLSREVPKFLNFPLGVGGWPTSSPPL